jgi:prefoldin subunit 5
MRLQQEVQTLRVQKSEMDELKADIDKVKELLKKG